MTMDTWSEWINHDDSGWPKGIEPDEPVIVRLRGQTVGPVSATGVDWHFPEHPVLRYKRLLTRTDEVELEYMLHNAPIDSLLWGVV